MKNQINNYLKNNFKILNFNEDNKKEWKIINTNINNLITKIKINTNYRMFAQKKLRISKNIITIKKEDNKRIIKNRSDLNQFNNKFNKNSKKIDNIKTSNKKIKKVESNKDLKTLSISEINFMENNTFIDCDLEDTIWKKLNFEENKNSIKTIKLNEKFKFSDTSKLTFLENLNNISFNNNIDENEYFTKLYNNNNKIFYYKLFKSSKIKDVIFKYKKIFYILNLKIKDIIKLINEIDIININILKSYNCDNIINFYLNNLNSFIDWKFLKTIEEFKISIITESYIKSIDDTLINNFINKIDTLPNDIIIFYKLFLIWFYNYDCKIIFNNNNEIFNSLKEIIFKNKKEFQDFLNNVQNIILKFKFQKVIIVDKIIKKNNFLIDYSTLHKFDEFTAIISTLIKEILYFWGIIDNFNDKKEIKKNYFKKYLYNQIKKQYLNYKLEEIYRIILKYNK